MEWGAGVGKLMLKSRKTQQKGQGQQSGQKQLPWPAQHRPSPSRRLATARVATAVGRPGFSPAPPAPGLGVGGPYRSHLLSQHIPLIPSLAPSQRQLTGGSLPGFGDRRGWFSFSALHGKGTRICSSRGVPAASAVTSGSQGDLGLARSRLPAGSSNPKAVRG